MDRYIIFEYHLWTCDRLKDVVSIGSWEINYSIFGALGFGLALGLGLGRGPCEGGPTLHGPVSMQHTSYANNYT